ncbi:filamentous hemagglutinin family protein [Luteolibacter ambystomatis]|uniref:Filamentous hemagglutinin family protein n=1 Tax=Luteolibacter ambystomatis TaxID=2824561 RepID=A0A975J046_9BACT|nr:filamentous haemagglutinin family protein [Luteolibacter ambystomatis]QUE51572.1 filamentous hemagglutinin family protein [Luteolibacter ambystomatis]
MKPRRHFLSRRFARKHAIRFGCVCTLATTIVVNGGDLLRGGAAANTLPAGAVATTNTPAPISANAAGNANDSLAKTTQAIQAVQAMQTAARNLAKNNGSNNLGQNPNNPSQTLPDVPDGLAIGGLEVDPRVGTDSTLWQGANLPVQSTNSGGTTQVTVKQTAQQALLNWKTFNVGKNTKLTFDQSAGGTDAGQWIAFNKVNDPSANPTQILGSIEAPGQVYIINRNGIIFGGGSQVNTHALVASSLPINATLVQNGLLNNPDHQFLFDGLDKGASDDIDSTTRFGDIIVQSGATITSPSSSAHVGGRVMLVGPNVTNSGTIATPDGQTILAAGLQVGVVAHDTSDASLRGLDVYIGAVVDPVSTISAYAGTATNSGLIDSARANITMAGKTVNQLGVISSTTSVSFNGRIDLLANYDAIANVAYDSTATKGPAYLNRTTGSVTLGEGSVTSVLPELGSKDKVVGSQLALKSQVNIFGQYVHFDDNSLLVATSGDVTVNAGVWNTQTFSANQSPIYFFMRSGGRIDLDAGSIIDVSGSKNVKSFVTSNIVEVELRGSELADSPLNRDGALRGQTIYVDITQTGVYNGKTWVGTPLADVSGYVNLVQRTVGELTTSGGTVNLNAGGSVVVRNGASVDVSGGWVNYEGGVVQTSRVMRDGKIIDITAATPDVKYDGVYTGGSTITQTRWGPTEQFISPLTVNGTRYQEGFTAGGSGGTLNISAPSMALDGSLQGAIHVGERQRALTPANSTLNLSFTADRLLTSGATQASQYSPTPPKISFAQTPSQEAVADYATDGSGVPVALPASRVSDVVLDSDLLGPEGFGSLSITNLDGDIVVPETVSLTAGRGGSITFSAANIDIQGSMTATGGSLSFTTYNISPAVADERRAANILTLPPANSDRGHFTLGARSTLSTAGLIVDDRPDSPTRAQTPLVTTGGKVTINSFSADLAQGSVIDVSGGVMLSSTGKVTYGNAGSVSIGTGRDAKLSGVTGGLLSLGSELRGYSGAKGGSLSLTTLAMQVGGTSSQAGTFVVDPSFFDQGGFSSFALSGIGTADTPGMLVTAGTIIQPQVTSWIVRNTPAGQPVVFDSYIQPEGLRSPVSLSFSSTGATDDLSGSPIVRAVTVVQAGAVIDAGALGSVSIKGTAVQMDGTLRARGGTLQVSGATNLADDNAGALPAVTVVLGSTAVLDASGATLLIPDTFGRRRGQVLDGGTITVSGNLVAKSGAVLDVSGTSGVLDLLPGESGQSIADLITTNPVTGKPVSTRGKSTTVESDGGAINLKGGELLLTDATLLGRAGGSTASGGTLAISSSGLRPGSGTGNFFFDPAIVVTNSGTVIPGTMSVSIGSKMELDASGVNGGVRFSADDFTNGGFANLDLGNPVKFSGDVTIHAAGRISVGGSNSGAIYANGNVNLDASHIVLGTGLGVPLSPEQKAALGFANGTSTAYLPAAHGSGSFNASADLIDVGYVSMQGIGTANLTADHGDIRGNGNLAIAGDLKLKAAQIYPPTAMDFTIAAFDYTEASVLHHGSVTIEGSGTKKLPLSAGGTLSIYASTIHQNGVLRAPFGTIKLGWDGTGTAPKDVLTGLTYTPTANLTLGSQSVTSVSAIDPVTGKGVTIPYGISPDGSTWLDPTGVDITSSGAPQKSIKLAGASVITEQGSQVDVRGGGDLLAFRFVSGLGGSTDILASSGSFAVIPGYDSSFAPYAPFGSGSALSGNPGYTNSSLQVGDQVQLQGGGGLPAGTYTLLPARYALLPGAYLVTPQSGTAVGTVGKPDGSSIVSGTRFNGMTSDSVPVIQTRFEVASAQTIAKRAEYTKLLANTFLTTTGGLRLPGDSGQLVLAATQAMAIGGQVFSAAGTGFRGGLIDISSPVDIVIAGAGAPAASGVLTLDASLLSSFGAESLLIGGYRQTTSEGTKVTVTTTNLTVDNAGSPLTGTEIILASKGSLKIDDGATIQQTGTPPAGDTLIFGDTGTAGSGNGALVRVGGSNASSILRRGVTVGGGVELDVGSGSILKGSGLVLDSTSKTLLSSGATLDAKSLSLSSGHVTLQLDPAITPGADAGLVIAGSTLASLSNAGSFALASYSSLDLLGAGTVGEYGAGGKPVLDSLILRAAEIRGLQNGGGEVDFIAKSISLDNLPGGTASTASIAGSGNLAFHAQTLFLGTGAMVVKGFSNITLDATTALQTTASGSFRAAGNLSVSSPVVYAGKATAYAVTADGSLSVASNGTSNGTVSAAGLGASLALTGSSVDVGSRIVLPSGDVLIHATSGNVTVSGSIEAGGISRRFKDVTKYTDGGRIRLTSDHGNVVLSNSGSLDVSARPGGGDGGELDVSAAEGTITLAGTALGGGGAGGAGGVFVMDTGSLASLAAIDTFLNTASFDASRSFRVRNGDVAVDGTAHVHNYLLAADRGSITLTGTIDASGSTGGSVRLVARDSVTLASGAKIDVSAADFDSAGKGGEIALETRGNNGGQIALQSGSLVDLTVDSWTASSAAAGKFQGTLHLRAPRNAANNDLAVAAIDGEVRNASNILVEGYKVYDVIDYGGIITTSVQSEILSSGQSFMGASGTTTSNYTAMMDRLLAHNSGLSSVLVLAPGAEVVNSATASNVSLSLNAAGAGVVVPSAGGTLTFPSGTPGNNRITSTVAGTITSASGVVTTLAANTATTIEAGSTITFASGGTVSFATGGTGGAIPVSLASGSTYNTSASNSVASVSTRGTLVTLNTAGTSGINLVAGARVSMPTGTVGTNRIRATVGGTITSPTGVVTNFAANTNTQVAAGSIVTLNSAGTLTFASGGTGGAIPVALVAGSFTTTGVTTVTPNTGNIVLGSTISTPTDDWNLSTNRFGPKGAPGVLTLRSSTNIVLYNSINDGFNTSSYRSALLARNALLPDNIQSWSYRITAGADLSAADVLQVQSMSSLAANSGSLLLGKNAFDAQITGGANALTSTLLASTTSSNPYQVIRTGSGDIDVAAGRDIRFLNQFATIYTAGTLVADQTLGGTFSTPTPSLVGSAVGTLGAIQQNPASAVQFTAAGGDIDLYAGNDIIHLTQNSLGQLIDDSEHQMPINWLYRRGYVDPATGEYGISKYGETASTAWWVDFTNFFEGVGALGGGNVTLTAGRDVKNVDAAVATNARMPGGKPVASKLVELGGGDLIVRAGRNIDGGVYYVERGEGTLHATGSVTTNATRSPSLGNFRSPAAILDPSTWLGTTLFVGKSSFDVSAGGDLLLGPVANVFMLPQGYNNSYWYKTWFSTYDKDSSVTLSSLGGSVKIREGVVNSGGGLSAAQPALQTWFESQLLLKTGTEPSVSFYQPWLRLTESAVNQFSTGYSLMPGSLSVTTFSGNISLVGNLTLSPSPVGNLELLSAGSVDGFQIAGVVSGTSFWSASRINLSDVNPASVPGVINPFAYQTLVGTGSGANKTNTGFLANLDALFAETGSLDGSLQKKQGLHTAGALHSGDDEPVRIYSESDISGITLFSGKAGRILAGRDLRDIAIYLQNVSTSDVSVVSAGRDLIAYDANTSGRIAARSTGNVLASGQTPQAGDIQIAGPGTLEVFAGRDLDLGIGTNNTDGTGTGITSVGNGRNPYLPFGGADVIIGAGVGDAWSLDESRADFTAFINKFVKASEGPALLKEIGLTTEQFDALSSEKQKQVALQVFYLVLRDAGRNHNKADTASKEDSEGFKNYERGKLAITTLFPGDAWDGDITTQARDIRTRNGGDISIFAPGGSLALASTVIGNPLAPPGIITESGGDIHVFTRNDVNLGISRIFTLRGGDEIIWSSLGNIAAGSSSKTVQSAPPTRVLIDPQSADVKTDLAGLATGGGIGVLTSVAGVKPGDVDLIAPVGTVDAGDAGIRVSGNLNIAAAVVANAGNISVGGNSAGTPSLGGAGPGLGSLAASSNTAAATNTAVNEAASRSAEPKQTMEEMPSIIVVEVVGYGGSDEDEPSTEEQKDHQPAEG